jgi:hypothetical protein
LNRVTTRVFSLLAALGLVAGMASFASAQGAQTLQHFAARGPSAVQQMSVNGFTLFIPTTRQAGAPILTWGNGTGASPSTYSGLLTNWASYGILVVASNSPNTGTGSQMDQGITVIQNGGFGAGDYVCTAGHSQGGAGTVNAARDSRVDCTMPIQPDTTFTASANGRDISGKPSLILCGTSDNLAPCGNANATRNGNGLFNQSSGPVEIVFLQGATHFEPASGANSNGFTGISTAWLVANMFRDASARALFFGPNPQIQNVSGWVNERFKGTSGL